MCSHPTLLSDSLHRSDPHCRRSSPRPLHWPNLPANTPNWPPLLSDPELDSAYKQFLIVYQEGGKEAAIDLARRRGLLNNQDEIRVTLILDTYDPAPLVGQLQEAGIRVITAYRDRVEIAIPLELIEVVSEDENPGAIFGQLTELEHVISVRVPVLHTPQGSQIEGEGIRVIGADRWHQAGFTGAGIRIGVLDMGFAGYQALLGRELPDNVVVAYFGDWNLSEVHGTACAEIVHEIAPGAELFFAWYDGSDAAMGMAVDWLLSQGVHIISHSAGSFVSPRDGTGWAARLVDSVAARGVLWVNAAGNEAQSHYRAPFTDTDGDGIHEFAPGEELMTLYLRSGLEIGEFGLALGRFGVFLGWDDTWGRASQDYELYLTDRNGNVVFSSEYTQNGQEGQDPAEFISFGFWPDNEAYVAVKAYAVDRPAMLDIFVNGAEVAYPSPEYSVITPADAVGALAVGAAHWRQDALADYSSRGPTTDGRLKPEISAPTGVSSASYNEPFEGTSASAPHVAGAAALIWQAYPEFTRQQVIDFLLSNAVDRGPQGPDTGYGYGRLQLPSPPSVIAAEPPYPSPTALPPLPVETPVPPTETAPLPTATPTLPTATPPPPTATPPPAAAVVPLPSVTPTPPTATTPPPTETPLSPTPTALPLTGTPVPLPSLPTPTPVQFVTPEPPPAPGAGKSSGLLRLLAGAIGLMGLGFLLGGAVVWVLTSQTVGIPSPRLTPRVQPPYPVPPSPPEEWLYPPPAPPATPPSPAPTALVCPHCGASRRVGARYCSRCGQPITSPQTGCLYCGTQLRPGARFCHRCGRQVGSAR